eukprot:gene25445-22188_t
MHIPNPTLRKRKAEAAAGPAAPAAPAARCGANAARHRRTVDDARLELDGYVRWVPAGAACEVLSRFAAAAPSGWRRPED